MAVPVTAGNPVLAADLTSVLAQINAARTKWGLGTASLTFTASNSLTSANIASLKTWLDEANTASASSTAIGVVAADYASGAKLLATTINALYNSATTIKNYCACQCNYCTCNCNNCACDCNYCTCNCNYCTCVCNYACTCQCAYLCTCQCQYICTCDCNYACTCDCNYCSCNCNDGGCGCVEDAGCGG